MKTYRQAITTQRELNRIRVVDTTAAKRLFDLRKKLNEAVEFVIERQKAIMDETGVTYDDTGRWVYPDDETREKFDRMNAELLDTETEIEPVTVKAAAVPGLDINDIAALDGFVEVEE